MNSFLLDKYYKVPVLSEIVKARARGEGERIVAAEQLVDTVEDLASPGDTVLDAGCATGYYFRYFLEKGLPVAWHGLDLVGPWVRYGLEEFAPHGIDRSRLRHLAVQENTKVFDMSYCYHVLHMLPNYHEFLHHLCMKTKKCIVIRTSLDKKPVFYFNRHVHIHGESYRNVYEYDNIFQIDDFVAFIENYGFEVRFVEDRYSQDCYQVFRHPERPDITYKWRTLVAERVDDTVLKTGVPPCPAFEPPETDPDRYTSP